MTPIHIQSPRKHIGKIVFLVVAIFGVGFASYQYGVPNARDFVQSRVVPAAEKCVFSNNPPIARTIRIGPDFAEGPNTCLSLAQLYAKSPDFCVRPGDQILLQQGMTFFGRLKLKECAGLENQARGTVTISTIIPGSLGRLAAADKSTQTSKNMKIPAEAKKAINPDSDVTEDKTFLVPAKQAINIKLDGQPLQWERVTSTVVYNGKELPHLKDWFVYRMKVPNDIKIKQFYYNNWMLPVARHPNAPTNPTWEEGPSTYFPYDDLKEETVTSQDGKTITKITHVIPRPSDQSLEGLKLFGIGADAAAIVRNSPWSLIRLPIASLDADGTGFTLKGHIRNATTGTLLAEPGHGFILMNALPLMDQPGEWYFDPIDHYLYFYYWNPLDIVRPFEEKVPQVGASWFALDEDPTWSPTNKDPYMNAGIELVGKHNAAGEPTGAISEIRIDGIRVFTSAGAGIRLKDVPTVAVNNVHVSSTTDQGILINGSKTVTIEDSFISNTGNIGIAVGPSFVGAEMVAPVENITITRNVLNKIGRIANQSAIDLMSGIRVAAYFRASITDNTISNTAYTGISAGEPFKSDTSSLNISRNIISFFLGLLNDGGGIYVNGMELAEDDIIHTNKTISGNTISNPIGNRDGTPYKYGYECSEFGGSEVRMIGAIYLDHLASYYTGHSNVVTGVYEPYTWLVRNRGIGNCFPPLKGQGPYLVEDCFSEGGNNTFEPKGNGKLPQCGGKNPIPLGKGKSAAMKVDR